MKKNFILLVAIISLQQKLIAQNVGIGTSTPNSSAILDVSSTSKGILLPRMSTTQRNAIVSPAVGLSVFNVDDQAGTPLHERLSEREFQIMCMLANGISVTEIGKKLFISDKTVSTHRTRILGKMGMKKNAELTLYAVKNGMIE